MSRPDIIVIGASTGGVVALTQLIQDLPSQLPAAIFIVVHTPANLPCWLPQILQNCGELPAVHAVDAAAIEQGCIYIAPPNRHLLVKGDYMHVVFEPKENGFRPAIDPLFRTAAAAYDKRVVGIVLSGGLFDGIAGLMEIKQRGGVAIVQDPNEALVSTMPQTAIKRVAVDYILPIANMASVLLDLVYELNPR
jgi:two-component system, chemotaxis family, protein-glutamate methylesterase/glutaminase